MNVTIRLLLVAALGAGCSIESLTVPEGYQKVSEESGVYVKNDKFTGKKFYRHPALMNNTLELYGVDGDPLRVCFYYKAASYINFNTVHLVNSKGEKMSFVFEEKQIKRSPVMDGIYEELADVALTPEQTAQIEELLRRHDRSKGLDVRFEGEYYNDLAIYTDVIEANLKILEFNKGR